MAVSAQRPGDGVQDRGLSLVVPAADHRKAILRGGDSACPDALHILQLQAGDFDWFCYRIHDASFLSS